MSHSVRSDPRARKFATLPASRKGPNGERLCCWCGKGPLEGGRRRWCSQACVDDYLCRSSQTGVRKVVWRRDRGRCAGCGADTERIARILRLLATLGHGRTNTRREAIPEGDPEARLCGYLDGVPSWGWRYVEDPYPMASRRAEQLEIAILLVELWVGGSFTIRNRRNGYLEYRSLWEADHIVPLAEGGAPGPENTRTMCLPCHKAQTRALADRLAAARRPPATPDPQLDLLPKGA